MSSGIGMDGMTSGVYPLAYTMALEEWNERDRTALEGKKAKVSITAPENLAGQIQSTLYSGGGLEIQVS